MIDLKTVIVAAFKEANLRPDYGSMELVGRPCLGAQSVIGTRTVSNGYLGHAFDLDRLATIIGQLVHDAQMDAFSRGRVQGYEDARKADARRLK